MNVSIDTYVRRNIRALKPYRSARQDHLSGLLLDANENSFGSTGAWDGIALNRYPDPLQRDLRRRLAALHGVDDSCVFVGVGSDEAIDLLFRIFCVPAVSNVIIPEPTYGMYRVAASIHDVEIRSCELTDSFQLDTKAILARVDAHTRIAFSCSPNNPTGNCLDRGDMLRLCDINAVVVVDEAYADFSNSLSLIPETLVRENLVVLRTLSKAWGLAAIRCGYAIAHPKVIEWMMRVKSPYNMNTVTAALAVSALGNQQRMQETVGLMIKERKRLAGLLAAIASVERVFPSEANFVLVRCTDADRIYEELVARGVIIRNRSMEPKLSNCLRVTVGTPDENDRLLSAWKEILP